MLGEKWRSRVAQSITQGLIVVPVPLHPKRLRQRGFNQSADIAKTFASALGIPARTDFLSRVRDTPSQRPLNKQERAINMKNAFSASAKASGLSFILIDDIMTTGATLFSAAQALIKVGANVYGVASLARD